MIDHCAKHKALHWLEAVLTALACTGLRIGELAQLRWSAVDLERKVLEIVDESRTASRRATARTTKGRRGRSLPLRSELLAVLERLPRHRDGLIFHGPRGGVLKPDTTRNVLVREVLKPLSPKFPKQGDEPGFTDGRLHSLRHYFCSLAARSGTPELTVMKWLGHRDSAMVRRYFHLYDSEAQRQMSQLKFPGSRDAT